MANCHNLFEVYNENLQVSSAKKAKLIKSKDALREKIRKYFKDKHPEYVPEFYIQGSYKMGTTIRTKDDICDLDDGVYFLREPDVNGTTLQSWVRDAVDGHTDIQEHREKCIRVIYTGDYEIDLPVYYKLPGEKSIPFLAVKNKDWEKSDPKEFVNWFKARKDQKGQLVRIVRYLKGWCDFKRHKMPSGLAMSILAANNINYNDRDDIALRDTLKRIKSILNVAFSCMVPATPFDDLFSSYDKDRKDRFLTTLDEFIESADQAINSPNQKHACLKWQKHLGNRFPCDIADDIDETSNQYSAPTILTRNAQSA